MKLKEYAIALTVSLLILCLSIYGIIDNKNSTYKTTTGTIREFISEFSASDDSPNTYPLIDYKAQGKWYKGIKYPSYNFKMEIGDEVKVYYNIDNPEEIQAEGYKIVPYVTLAGSSIMLLVSTVIFLKKR